MATLSLTGSANGLIKYTGDYDIYIKITNVGSFSPVKTDRVGISCGTYSTELVFDDATQRDAAITTLLTYF